MTGPRRHPDADAADPPANRETQEGRPRSVSVGSDSGGPAEDGTRKPDRDPRGGGLGAWWWAAAPLALGVALTVLARFLPERVEALYSRGLYPRIGAAVQALAERWLEFCGAINGDLSARRPSFSEVLVGVVVGAVVVALVRAVRRGWGVFLRRALWLSGAAYLAFMLGWGLNHARLPLGDTLGLQVAKVSANDLNDVALELERDLSNLLREEDPGLETQEVSAMGIGAAALAAWTDALARDARLGWQPSPMLCAPASSGVLVASGISGIFSPFSQEAHVAFGLPEVDLAFTACHEIAHVQGWAREDEANYLAWRVGSRSQSRVLKKAALALALVHVHHALRVADPRLQHQRALSMDVRVVNLLQERSSFWSKRKSRVASRAVGAANNTYLKSQGHAGGVASYGRMVDLLVAELR